MHPSPLAQRHCLPLHGAGARLAPAQAGHLLSELADGWKIGPHGDVLERDFRFSNFRETMGFVNAVAWMAECENHHPELRVRYNACAVRYSTHDVGGLSENDFICAARIDAQLAC
ncbi:MAG: 4a-hydroxytetrahydrobiopterin dehydratase [Pseudomonadota bacterium]